MTNGQVERASSPGKAELALRVGQLVAELAASERASAEARARASEYLDDLQRLQAEFDNFRKRMASAQELAGRRSREGLLRSLLPIVDAFDRVIEAERVDGEALELCVRALRFELERAGISEIEADGLFDPHRHEAVSVAPSESADDKGKILVVVERGYMLGEMVLRPAKVVVASGPTEAGKE